MAEGKDFTKTLENLVTCVICHDILKNPKTLPCLHTFCFKCIEDRNKTCNDNRLRFSCPSCKALVNVPDGDVVNIPTSFHHNSLVQFNNTLKNQAGDPQQSQDCSGCSNRRVAVGFCFQCQGIVCNECYNAHKTLNVFKDHQALLWNEFNKANINRYIKNKSFCQQKFHDKCLLGDCKGNTCYTDKALLEINIQDNGGNDVHNFEIAESQHRQFTVKFRAEKPSAYNVAVCIGGKTIQNLPQTVNVIDASAEFKPVTFFRTTRAPNPVALCISAKGHIAIVNNNKKNKCCIVLYNTDGEFVRAFGDEGIGEDRLSLPRGLAFIDDDHILVSDNTDDGACIKQYHIDGRLIRTVHKQKGMFFSRMCTRVNSIVCLSYDRRSGNTSVKLFSRETGDYLQDIKLHDSCPIAEPLFIAYIDKKYFVSFRDVDNFSVFHESGGYLYSIGQRGDKEGQFGRLRGLTVFGADMLLVCDEVNDRVQLFRQDGHFIRTFGSSGSGLGQMNWPCDVAVARDGQIYVLEYRNQRIQVFR